MPQEYRIQVSAGNPPYFTKEFVSSDPLVTVSVEPLPCEDEQCSR